MTDNFNGDTPHLISCIEALLKLDAAGSLVPHGIPGHARTLLEAAAVRLSAATPCTPAATSVAPADRLQAVLSELVEAQDALTRANIAFNERLRTAKFFTFTGPSPEAQRVDAAWSAVRRAVAGLAAEDGVAAYQFSSNPMDYPPEERAALGTPAALPPPPDDQQVEVIVEPPPERDELLARADRLASALRGSRVNYAVEQQAAETMFDLCDALRAAGVPHRESDSIGSLTERQRVAIQFYADNPRAAEFDFGRRFDAAVRSEVEDSMGRDGQHG